MLNTLVDFFSFYFVRFSSQRYPSSIAVCILLFANPSFSYTTDQCFSVYNNTQNKLFKKLIVESTRPGLRAANISIVGVNKPAIVSLTEHKTIANQLVAFEGPNSNVASKTRSMVFVQGTPTEIIYNLIGQPIYVIFANQPVRILESLDLKHGQMKVIEGQDFKTHSHGFSSPLGRVLRVQNSATSLNTGPLGNFKIETLKRMLGDVGEKVKIEYESGVIIEGVIDSYTPSSSGATEFPSIITFSSGTCSVKLGDRVLFEPSWGSFDMLVSDHSIVKSFTDSRNYEIVE